jgi:outer membrane lipoprotein carrier protein
MVYKNILIVLIFVSNIFASTNLEDLKSLKANFIQTITSKSNKTIKYKGELFIKNNGKVLWQYKSPIIKNVYVINDIVIVDEPELEQVIYTTLEKNINMLKLLKEAKQIDENKYLATLYEVEYLIQMNENKILSLSYKDELENKILITFLKSEENIEIRDEIFQFLPPEHYDIIEK